MGNGTHGQMGTMVNIKDRHRVPWGMGHMDNWAHDHNFLNTAWIFTKIGCLADTEAEVTSQPHLHMKINTKPCDQYGELVIF